MSAENLDQAIKAVCPIFGVSIGRKDDKATWRIDFTVDATEKQRSDAQAILAAYVWTDTLTKQDTVADLKAALIAKGVLTAQDVAAAIAPIK